MSIEAMTAVLGYSVGDSTRKLVLLGLANHAHRDGTAAWAGVDTLKDYADCSARTVQRHITKLLEDGFIREGDQSVIDSRIPARYRPIAYEVALNLEVCATWKAAYVGGLRDVSAAHGSKGGKASAQAKRGANLSPLQVDASHPESGQVSRGDNLAPLPEAPKEPSGVTPVTLRGDTGDAQGVTPVSPKPSREPSKNQNPLLTLRESGEAGSDAEQPEQDGASFEAFYAAYPRKQGKQAARKSWQKAIAAGADPAAIVHGARRFAADPNLPCDDERQFVPYPATWLNGGRWEDDALPPRISNRAGKATPFRNGDESDTDDWSGAMGL